MNDPTCDTLYEALRPLVADVGLPPLREVLPGAPDPMLVQAEAVFVDSSRLLLQAPRSGLPLPPAAHLAAARAELARMDAAPPVFHLLDAPALRARLILRSAPRGTPIRLAVRRGDLAERDGFVLLGHWLGRRRTNLAPSGSSDGRFVPVETQRQVLVQLLLAADRSLRASGFDSGAAGREVAARFKRLIEHVPEPEGCALTHGHLGLDCLRLDDDALVEIQGWTRSLCIDPLYELGALLHHGREALDAAIEGWAGVEVDEQRLAVGFFGRALVELATLASVAARSPQPKRARLETEARERLEQTLSNAPMSWTRAPVPRTPDPVWARLADVARSLPRPDARDLGFCAAAVAATELTDQPHERRLELAHRYLDQLSPRWVAPPGDVESPIANPVLDCVGAAVSHAFSGEPPKGFYGGLVIWDQNLRPVKNEDGWEALRWRCLQSWAETSQDGAVFKTNWDMFSWRIEAPLTPAQAIQRAIDSDDPYDLPRVLGALQLKDGPPIGEVLAVLFPAF